MSGTITVQTIQGPTTGSNANQVLIPSGHNLRAKNNIVQVGSYCTGYGSGARLTTTSTSWNTINIGGTGQILDNTIKNGSNVIGMTKISNSSHLELTFSFPHYMEGTGDSGCGIRCQGYSATSSINSGNAHLIDLLPNGFANRWGLQGYGDLSFGHAFNTTFTWTTRLNSNYINDWKTYTGIAYFYWEVANWNSNDTSYWIDYNDTHPKYGMITWREVEVS